MSYSSFPSPPPSPPPAPDPFPLSSSYSSLIHCPELDLSVTLGSTTKTSHSQPKPPSQQSGQSQLKPQIQTGRGGNMQVRFKEPVVVTVTAEQSRRDPLQHPIRGPKRNRRYHHVIYCSNHILAVRLCSRTSMCSHGEPKAPRLLVEPPAGVSNQDPGFLERAGLNTTLAVKAELLSLQGAEFNSQKAIQETLQRSGRTNTLINTRATEEVNVSRSQLLFTSLVGVDVREDELISQVLQQRLPPPCQSNKAAEGPSLLFFMTSDHLRQKPVPLEEEPVNYKLRPLSCPAYTAFDLHRRGRC